YFAPDRFKQAEWGHLSDKFLGHGYEQQFGEVGAFRGSGIATAYMSGFLACIAEARPEAGAFELMDALRSRALTPEPALGYA
ncbi:MAG: hypothetical protein ACPGTU_17435, partial [Myxococcota bacterium]